MLTCPHFSVTEKYISSTSDPAFYNEAYKPYIITLYFFLKKLSKGTSTCMYTRMHTVSLTDHGNNIFLPIGNKKLVKLYTSELSFIVRVHA